MDEETARATSALRQPGSNALAFVMEPARTRRAATGQDLQRAGATTAALLGAGWSVLQVTPEQPIGEAWRRLTGGERLVVAS